MSDTFVSTEKMVADNYEKYLPKSEDIHFLKRVSSSSERILEENEQVTPF